jgi:tetratricopeptide (TPR) repeat protein
MEEQDSTLEPTQPPGYDFESPEEYFSAAAAASRSGTHDESIAIMREAVQRWPEDATAHFDLAAAIFMKLQADRLHLELWEDLADEEDLAEECFSSLQSAISRDPNMAPAYRDLGTLLALRGRPQKAIEAWEQALKIDPDQPALATELEMLRSKLKESD